jgi:hypothetical protein
MFINPWFCNACLAIPGLVIPGHAMQWKAMT